MDYADRRWVTFDCFGTLVDWNSGFSALLRPFAGRHTPDVMKAYHRFERLVESETPHRLYKDVLVTSLRRAADEVGLTVTDSQARTLADAWGTLPVFEDVEPMLARLRTMGWRLAVPTNCDEDLFEQTQRSFQAPFDLVVTAERVRDYKPSHSHFRFFSRSSGAENGDWVHVACSWYHDIAPARDLGIRRVWLDRDHTGEDPTTASVRITSASEVCEAIGRLLGTDGSPEASSRAQHDHRSPA
jgi:2-haloacid dehalogenase